MGQLVKIDPVILSGLEVVDIGIIEAIVKLNYRFCRFQIHPVFVLIVRIPVGRDYF